MLIFILTLASGPVAQSLLTQGVAFEGITLGVVAPEGDPTGELLQQLTDSMRDIRQYARFVPMVQQEAELALVQGELTAVLVLPEDFVAGVLNGTNPDVTLVAAADRPLESLLTYWVGRSAADMLTAAQLGIYGVLELYPGEAAAGKSWDTVKYEINLRYIQTALNRESFFETETLTVAGAVDIGQHYALCLLLFFALCLPPVFLPAFHGDSLGFCRRVNALGYGGGFQYCALLTACAAVLLPLCLLPGLYLQWNWAGLLLLGAFAALWAGLFCQISSNSALCGGAAVAAALGMLFLTGGILPPALLPKTLREMGELLPAAALRELLYQPMDHWQGRQLLLLGLWSGALAVLGGLLHCRRLRKEVAV